MLIVAALVVLVCTLGGLGVAGAIANSKAVRAAEAQIERSSAGDQRRQEALRQIHKLEVAQAATGQNKRLTASTYIATLPEDTQQAARSGNYTDPVLEVLLERGGSKA